jgi:CheY-like chemotaxis protein
VVLLVEDDEPLRRVLGQVLARLGYHVVTAADGADALTAAAAFAGPIDLLLTDVIMPRMSGQRLAEALCAERPGLKVVFMSGHASDVVGPQGGDTTALRILQKPVTPESIAAVVQSAFGAPLR